MAEELNYKRIKMKAGVEIHQQLDTKEKLFCSCSTAMAARNPIMEVQRKLHPVASELGEVDVSAQYEYLRDRVFNYQVFRGEDCLVELDEEPPHDLNSEALHAALQIAILLNCKIPEEVHVMRKTVIDGSNTTGFQRTAVIGLNGYLRYKGKRVEITQVCLEEDAAAIVEQTDQKATYRLNRLGVPLVEISTGVLADMTPEDVQEIAYMIGIICRSIGKVKHGIGSIRQDLNVSIRNGPRVEIKGVQELGMLAKVVKKEAQRQIGLRKVEHETRAVDADGSTHFMRPLPGSARMYPETDVRPMTIMNDYVKEIRSSLPEPFTNKLARFKTKMKLSHDLAEQIISSEYLELFEKITKNRKVDPAVVANTFVSTLKDLRRREKMEVDRLKPSHFIELFDSIARKTIVKEAVPDILKYLAENADATVKNAVEELNLEIIKKSELVSMVSNLVKESPELAHDKVLGIVMSRVRGRVNPEDVMKVVKRFKRK
jgi:Glu-tRNA(Gln) amidotransferase subunit E-like FAD-binding protein